jgi:hypothetical protein
MKIERILYGMQTSDGKIAFLKTSGVNTLLQFKSIEYIRTLKPKDSKQRLYFKTEGTLAYPYVVEVADKHPDHGGRTWVQNQTFLVTINDFLDYVQAGKNPFQIFEGLIQQSYEQFPQFFEAVNV